MLQWSSQTGCKGKVSSGGGGGRTVVDWSDSACYPIIAGNIRGLTVYAGRVGIGPRLSHG